MYFIIIIVFYALVGLFLIRNQLVYGYKMKQLKRVSSAAKYDILSGREWMWRYEVYRQVGYGEMLFKFWRRFDSFYPDKSFLDPECRND